jgi:hypothetical protein
MVWRAEEDVPAGQEVCNSYKTLFQDRALLQYGFLQVRVSFHFHFQACVFVVSVWQRFWQVRSRNLSQERVLLQYSFLQVHETFVAVYSMVRLSGA